MLACTTCNRPLQQAIFDSTFFPNLFTMLSGFIVVGLIVIALRFLAVRYEKRKNQLSNPQSLIPLLSTAAILGIGMGGFIDGIVLHQILQWHEMLSNKIPPISITSIKVNMFWDGIFHLFTFIVTLFGITSLFQVIKNKRSVLSSKALVGGMLLGWALFNITEGVIDHHILKLHNVREAPADPNLWNYAFLIFSIALLLISGILVRHAFQESSHISHGSQV